MLFEQMITLRVLVLAQLFDRRVRHHITFLGRLVETLLSWQVILVDDIPGIVGLGAGNDACSECDFDPIVPVDFH